MYGFLGEVDLSAPSLGIKRLIFHVVLDFDLEKNSTHLPLLKKTSCGGQPNNYFLGPHELCIAQNMPLVTSHPFSKWHKNLVIIEIRALIKGALDKYNIYLFIYNSIQNDKLNQYRNFQLILPMRFHFMRYFVNSIILLSATVLCIY